MFHSFCSQAVRKTVFLEANALVEEERVVVIRFGRDHDPDCMRQDEALFKIAERVKNFAVIYLCDIDQTVYRGAKKGRGLVVSPKDYSTRHKY
ncbi:hypothetical protein N0V88_001929 [Collariella sp. IMI 366227]|nr:hypothetical protein N0V88_001929 [Collariella sp. IMI 366227]